VATTIVAAATAALTAATAVAIATATALTATAALAAAAAALAATATALAAAAAALAATATATTAAAALAAAAAALAATAAALAAPTTAALAAAAAALAAATTAALAAAAAALAAPTTAALAAATTAAWAAATTAAAALAAAAAALAAAAAALATAAAAALTIAATLTTATTALTTATRLIGVVLTECRRGLGRANGHGLARRPRRHAANERERGDDQAGRDEDGQNKLPAKNVEERTHEVEGNDRTTSALSEPSTRTVLTGPLAVPPRRPCTPRCRRLSQKRVAEQASELARRSGVELRATVPQGEVQPTSNGQRADTRAEGHSTWLGEPDRPNRTCVTERGRVVQNAEVRQRCCVDDRVAR
jgi:hypothetical protein